MSPSRPRTDGRQRALWGCLGRHYSRAQHAYASTGPRPAERERVDAASPPPTAAQAATALGDGRRGDDSGWSSPGRGGRTAGWPAAVRAQRRADAAHECASHGYIIVRALPSRFEILLAGETFRRPNAPACLPAALSRPLYQRMSSPLLSPSLHCHHHHTRHGTVAPRQLPVQCVLCL